MRGAKQASKHGYELFESGMEVPVLKRHGLKQRLREAVREDSFDVHVTRRSATSARCRSTG
jgi:hypothetical protein